MTKYLPIIITVISTLSVTLLSPSFVSAHPAAFGILTVVAQILHAALPSVFKS